MEQLLKWTKSRFSHGGQLRPMARAVQSCGMEEGTDHFTPGSSLSGERSARGLQREP